MSSTFVIFGLLLAGIIVLVAWASEILSRVTRIPNIVFYLVFAIILGPIGVRFLHPGIIIPNLDLLDLVIAISFALIVFEGGYSFNRCFRTITDEEGVHTFQSGLVQLAIASVFLLLTAFITWDLLYVTLFTPFFLAGFVVVGLLILVIRPLGVLVSTLRTKITVRERLFMSFFGPRGIVIAATGVFFSITLQLDYGIVYPQLIGYIFLIVLMTVIIQAGLAPFTAKACEVCTVRYGDSTMTENESSLNESN